MNLYNYKFTAALMIAFLAGCTPKVAQWTPAESPKENKVQRTFFTHVIHTPSSKGSLSDQEKKKLLEFLKVKAPRPSAVSVIIEETGTPSKTRVKEIQRELVKYGIS